MEKASIDLFVHAGCCMHKELNTVKGSNTWMTAYWAKVGVQGLVLLMNKANGPAAEAGTWDHAEAVSIGGGVKVTELVGNLFNHKDDKKGQQDVMRYYFEAALGTRVNFAGICSGIRVFAHPE